ncbi:MAG: C10 family peptidase [Bacteroidales bacterium]|nr:C10 family peptidase [Bacteroidales bacterium]MCM1146310.1 C10 family peptidase [Bacteroidales bacterium]MCM1205252.1 C10 family peptidase [Bacillota bacterium]MCM1509663.1 C10 family peptidase [Clostridium sp.]
MKIRTFLFLIQATLLCLSCNNDASVNLERDSACSEPMALTLNEVLSLNEKTGKELSEQEVMDIIKNYMVDINQNSVSAIAKAKTISKSPKFKISSKCYLGEDDLSRNLSNIKTPIYEVRIDNGDGTQGLAIVGGDDRYPVVIAYIPSYNDDRIPKEPIAGNMNFMLELSKTIYKNNLENIVSEQSNKGKTIEKIAKGLNLPVKYVDAQYIDLYVRKYGVEKNPIEADLNKNMARVVEPSDPMEELGSKLVRSYGKPCGTEWDQLAPYNGFYPVDWIKLDEYDVCSMTQHPAGCAVTAIAQILAALEPEGMVCNGISIDWAYLKEKKTVNSGPFGEIDSQEKINMVAALFKDIYDKTNSAPLWGVGETDSWPPETVPCVLQTQTTSANVYNYFSNTSGVTVVNNNIPSMIKWDPEMIRRSLQYSFPVFVGGNRHAFVLDEFLYCVKTLTTYELVKQYDVYFHANFGQGLNAGTTGYYLVKDTQNGSITFRAYGVLYKDSDMSILPFIGKR